MKNKIIILIILLFVGCDVTNQGALISKNEKEYMVVWSSCYRGCSTTVVDYSDGSRINVSATACNREYSQGRKVKGTEYIYEMVGGDNKKIGTIKKVYLFDPEDCK